MLRSSNLPLGYLTDGQNVPDDIEVARPTQVARLVLGIDACPAVHETKGTAWPIKRVISEDWVCRASALPPVAARPRLTVVAGGKGGVGTTALALNLAVVAAASKGRTALVDADADGQGSRHSAASTSTSPLPTCSVPGGPRRRRFEPGPGNIRVLPGDWGSTGAGESPRPSSA